MSQFEEKILPREKGKSKVDEVKPVLIKLVATFTKGFNTTTNVKREFLEELTKNLDH